MGNAPDLTDYNTVPERLTAAKAGYPDGRFRSRIVEVPAAFADKFLAVEATFYRTPDDPMPAIGLAWEPVPGTTPYTRNSELQNAETSAWGRALIAALVADASKGVASREEVRNRQGDTERVIDDARRQTVRPKACPACSSAIEDNRDFNNRRALEGKKRVPSFKCMNEKCTANNGKPWIAWEAFYFDEGDLQVDRGTGEIVEPPVARDDYGPDEAPF